MRRRPLHDRILVQRREEGEQQVGRIITPDSVKETSQRGTLVPVGAGRINDDGARVRLDVKAGDPILFGKYAGQAAELDGIRYLILREDDVLAALDVAATPESER
jgi:chaperonin GroES